MHNFAGFVGHILLRVQSGTHSALCEAKPAVSCVPMACIGSFSEQCLVVPEIGCRKRARRKANEGVLEKVVLVKYSSSLRGQQA